MITSNKLEVGTIIRGRDGKPENDRRIDYRANTFDG